MALEGYCATPAGEGGGGYSGNSGGATCYCWFAKWSSKPSCLNSLPNLGQIYWPFVWRIPSFCRRWALGVFGERCARTCWVGVKKARVGKTLYWGTCHFFYHSLLWKEFFELNNLRQRPTVHVIRQHVTVSDLSTTFISQLDTWLSLELTNEREEWRLQALLLAIHPTMPKPGLESALGNGPFVFSPLGSRDVQACHQSWNG